VDSFPLPVCDNYRIGRCRLYQALAFRGYVASKKHYFYGLRVHVIVTASGQPVDVVLASAAEADVTVLRRFHFDLPEGAIPLYADKAYTQYGSADVLKEDTALTLIALRKKNSTRPLDGCLRFVSEHVRKRIETTFSQITDQFAKRIYAVTARRGCESLSRRLGLRHLQQGGKSGQLGIACDIPNNQR
jgi:hypothetical protein